ncbi:MAG: pectate lyase [Melioribacteraceae bacterium]|nr:pectate lyase [Melioribacteraceae bacterium]
MLKKNFVNMVFVLSLVTACTNAGQIDLSRFYDSAHHWYDINDEKRVINPLPDKPVYDAGDIEKIADNIILFQKNNGGWAKNYDMQAILSPEQIVEVKGDKNKLNTTFDNGATHSQLTYLAEVYTITKKEKYKEAFLKGLDYVFSAQYDNGGWPQFFPDTSGYRKYITFNDGAMIGVMNLLFDIVYKNSSYVFIDNDYYSKSEQAFYKGLDCIINSQIVENGKTTVWCQQHDNLNLSPQNARSFEPAAICNMESAEIVFLLMKIDKPNNKIKNSIINAVKWFEESAIQGLRVEIINAPKAEFMYHTTNRDKRVVKDPNAPRIWARFYELKTHKPLFCRRDGVIVYSMEEVERERRTGYGWYHYAPETILKNYPNWQQKWN